MSCTGIRSRRASDYTSSDLGRYRAPMTSRKGYKLLTENLRRLTEAKMVPLPVLADRAGIDRTELFAAMAGEYDPDLDWLAKLADVLEVHIADLFEEPSAKSKPS